MSETAAPTAQASDVVTIAESGSVTPTGLPNPAPVAPEAPSSAKLLDLAKKEAAFIKKEVEYKQKLAEYEKRVEELSYFTKAKEVAKQDPEELLNKLGISYDELTQAMLDAADRREKGQKAPSVEELRKEIAKEFEQREAQKSQQMAEQAIQGFTKEIEDFISGNEAKFPHLTKLSGPLGDSKSPNELIFEVVSNYFEETGELLDLETAASTAEEYFREEWNKLNGVLTNTPAPAPVANTQETKAPVSPAASSASAAPAPVVTEDAPVNASRFKVKDATITNGMRPTSRIPYKSKDYDRRDVIEKAVAALESNQRR